MLAVIADDNMKADLIELIRSWRSELEFARIVATRDTGNLIRSRLGIDVELVEAGTRGGVVQIASRVIQGAVVAVVALHQPSLMPEWNAGTMALRQVCDIHNVAFASNRATADAVIAAVVLQGSPSSECDGAADWFAPDRQSVGVTIHSVSRVK